MFVLISNKIMKIRVYDPIVAISVDVVNENLLFVVLFVFGSCKKTV